MVGIDPFEGAFCKDDVDAFEVVSGQDFDGTCSVVEKYGIDAIVTAATDKPAKFQVITARGVVQETTGTDMKWELVRKTKKSGKPIRRGGPAVEVFARVKAFATDGSEEVLFSQPFMLF